LSERQVSIDVSQGKSDLNSTSKGGAPTALTAVVADAIVGSVRRGNFLSPSAEKAGVARNTVSSWKRKAEQGIEPYYSFFERVNRAISEAELETVQELREHSDWRAKAFWLERGPNRERWQQQQVSPATELAVSLLDTLRTRSVGRLSEAEGVGRVKELSDGQQPKVAGEAIVGNENPPSSMVTDDATSETQEP